MSVPRPARPAKLVAGFFLQQRDLAETLVDHLEALFGPADLVSPWLPFDFTAYYAREMGEPLYRRVIAFKGLIGQESLPDIKLKTNQVEEHFAYAGRRQVNIDPGYLLRERFILATGKDFSHRIYLRCGIYADLTLVYQKGRFTTLPWTYPDYADSRMLAFLGKVRRKYVRDLKA